MKELEQFLENELNGLALKKADWGHLTIEDDSRERTLLEVQELVKNLTIPRVSNLLCGSFEPDNKTSSATKCKCGREKWEHPKAT